MRSTGGRGELISRVVVASFDGALGRVAGEGEAGTRGIWGDLKKTRGKIAVG